MDILFVCVSVHHKYTCCWQRSEEGVGVPESGVAYSCELTCGLWELILGRQTEQKAQLLVLIVYKVVHYFSTLN